MVDQNLEFPDFHKKSYAQYSRAQQHDWFAKTPSLTNTNRAPLAANMEHGAWHQNAKNPQRTSDQH